MISKTLDVGGGYKLFLKIDDGIATMTSNYAKALIKIYWKTKTEHPEKLLTYDYRRNVMTERFKYSAEEFSKKIDEEFKMGMAQQKSTMTELKNKLDEEKKK